MILHVPLRIGYKETEREIDEESIAMIRMWDDLELKENVDGRGDENKLGSGRAELNPTDQTCRICWEFVMDYEREEWRLPPRVLAWASEMMKLTLIRDGKCSLKSGFGEKGQHFQSREG